LALFDQNETTKKSVPKSVHLHYSLAAEFFTVGLAGRFYRELATFKHMHTGRRNTLIFAVALILCPTSRGANN
jgi:hypothetical protein